MTPYIFVALPAVVIVFLLIVATRPAEFAITRSATMSAPSAAVFEQVNDFHRWRAWSPWENIDPDLKRTYEGPPAGVGTVYSWAGNKKVGEGRMTLTESRPGDLVRIRLEFLKPFKATNTTEFSFRPLGDKTQVTWTMTGRNGFVGRLFCMFMNMDKMVGRDFEKGLAAMKSLVEKTA
jgi:hypothetical protein